MLAYLASPFSDEDEAVQEQRFNDVCRAAGELLNAGNFVYSPIAHSKPIADQSQLPTDFAFWQAYDEEMIKRCDEVWVLKLEGWNRSVGIYNEVELAVKYGKPVRYLDPVYV